MRAWNLGVCSWVALGSVALLLGSELSAQRPAPASPAAVCFTQEISMQEISTQKKRGLTVHKRDVLYGNSRKTTKPAKVKLQKCMEATKEYKTIESESIEKGSARYNILIAKAHARVQRAVRRVAAELSHDCVVKSGSYHNPKSLDVVDITDDVVKEISD